MMKPKQKKFAATGANTLHGDCKTLQFNGKVSAFTSRGPLLRVSVFSLVTLCNEQSILDHHVWNVFISKIKKLR